MKILHVFPYLPTPPVSGGCLRIYHILKHLVKHHDVTVAGYCEDGDLNQFRESFPELEGKMHFLRRKRIDYYRMMQLYTCFFTRHSFIYTWSQSNGILNMIDDLLMKQDFDILLTEFGFMTDRFQNIKNVIRIVDSHNIEYDNFSRMSKLKSSWVRQKFYKREYKTCYREETGLFRKQDAVLVTSDRDAGFIKRDAPGVPVYVIPNGVDTAYFNPKGTAPEPYSMVFTGSMGYVPNYDGMIYFLDHIFPTIRRRVPEAKVYIVGNKPPEVLRSYQSDSVIITGFVEDVRPWIERAAVYVIPIYMGGGTRLKVMEALSMNKPVVSSTIGCEGINVTDGEHLMIRDDPGAFADAVIRLFQDRKLGISMAARGQDHVLKKYDWRMIGASMDRAFLDVLDMVKGIKNIEYPLRVESETNSLRQTTDDMKSDIQQDM